MGRRASSRFQLIPGAEPCQGSIARGVELAPGAHASARSSVRPPRRAHRRGHCRRAGVPRRRDRPPLSGLLLLLRLPRLSRHALGPHGRPRVRRPDRRRGRPLPRLPDGARRGRARPHPLRGRARRPALQPRAGAAPRSRGACSSGTSPPTSSCPRSCWRRGSSSSPRTPPRVPNRNFLVYMCLWAVSNVAVPEAVLGPRKYAAILVSFVPPLLSVHGWVFFLTYPVNPARQAWLSAAPRDPAALPRGAGGGHPVIAGLRGRVRGCARAPRRRLALSGGRWLSVRHRRGVLPHQDLGARRHAPPRPLAARGPADHGPHARHRPRARRAG